MKMNRRELLLTGGVSLLTGAVAGGQTAAPAETNPRAARLLEALQRNRLPISIGDTASGSGWDWLVREASSARFTLVGEENGVAETARFSSALFTALRRSGYSRMAVGLSPAMAMEVETAARMDGLKGITDVLNNPGAFTFYSLREEARFLADVIQAGPKNERVLWGLDREIFSDRYLISRLESKVPQRARDEFDRLKTASSNAWARFEQTRNPDDMFILAEVPTLVSTLRAQWPTADRESDTVMRTLEGSLAIETAERTGGRWPYFQSRAQWMRSNFADLIRADKERKAPPKILMRFGYNHVIRGANYINVFDIGAMADEVAALTGEQAFHIIVLPGPGSRQAVPGEARSFRSISSDQFDGLEAGDARLTRILPNPNAAGHEVINLRALRPLAMRGLESWNPDVVRTIHGYDAAVIWKGAKASVGF